MSIPETMTAALLLGRGGPEMLEIRTGVAVPVPDSDDVLVKVAACGLNNTDINTRVGWYSPSVTGPTTGAASDVEPAGAADDGAWGGSGTDFPRIQGADPSGRVVAVGSAVDPALIDRRVLIDPWIRDTADPANRDLVGYLGSELDGGFAHYCAVPARNVHVHSSPLTDVELASLPCSWSTAEHMLQRVNLSAGQSIAVTGASGGVGSALVSLARLRNARVVAVTGSAKADAVAALNPDAIVNRDEPEVARAAVEANGGPFDVVADVVGGGDVPSWLEALRRGGRYVTAGAIAGPMVDLDLRTLYLNDLELVGATVFEPQVFADLVGYVERGLVKPAVGAVFALEDLHQAQADFERKAHVGAIVVTMTD